eukprot:scaffold135255_cov13-Tisochrysis_lutea.AAC.1
MLAECRGWAQAGTSKDPKLPYFTRAALQLSVPGFCFRLEKRKLSCFQRKAHTQARNHRAAVPGQEIGCWTILGKELQFMEGEAAQENQ